MKDFLNVLTREEIASLKLRSLYAKYGYAQYKMSKFEAYDLYVKNKDFLVSDNVITFTDTDGTLLALKPDVTLSIIKNSRADEDLKVYYNENVYRVSKGTRTFKEIMQVGVERFGDLDNTAIAETLFLAAQSLNCISPNNILEISCLDIVAGVLNAFSFDEASKKEIFSCLGDKNIQGVHAICENNNLSLNQTEIVQKLVTLYGSIDNVLDKLSAFFVDGNTTKTVNNFINLLLCLKELGVGDKICVDFSVVNNMKYYNGIAFKGFIDGIPTGILSGGQYDRLMRQMNKTLQAIGFAVYLDELDRLPTSKETVRLGV